MVTDQLWQALILGTLQGLTEFLPISSSAHLILLPWFLGWETMGILFDVLLHGGTLIAILIYFRKDWLEICTSLFNATNRDWDSTQVRLAGAIVIGTLPAIVVALLLRSYIEEHLRSPLVTVFTLALFGILLFLADHRSRCDRTFASVSWRDGLMVGLAQSLALVPGVSRSGITITAALFLGLSRADSARLSFLLSAPIMVLGTLKGVQELVSLGSETTVSLSAALVGVATAACVGFLCIKYFLRYLQARTYGAFVLYRLLLAAVILVSWLGLVSS